MQESIVKTKSLSSCLRARLIIIFALNFDGQLKILILNGQAADLQLILALFSLKALLFQCIDDPLHFEFRLQKHFLALAPVHRLERIILLCVWDIRWSHILKEHVELVRKLSVSIGCISPVKLAILAVHFNY